jgi:hypothetical protein
MQHYDIYDDLLLESFKMDITKYGYGRLQLYRDKKIISKRTETFDSVFESIRLMNLQQAEDEIGVTCSDEDDEEKKKETTKKLILHRLNKIREILGG